jgi:hypothetical protein
MKSFVDTIWNNVECKHCKQKMTIDLSRRIIVAFAIGFWGIIGNTTVSYLDMSPIIWILVIGIFITGGFFIFTFDTFTKVDK